MTGMGLGSLLMRRLIDYARGRGLQEIFGHVLQVNRPMLAIARRLGFEATVDRDDPELKLVRLRL
jgi:acetyltransferase